MMCVANSVLWICVALLISSVGIADDGHVSREQVDDLIRKLDSATLADRSRAERHLLELGPEVLRLLPPPELIESVAAREAVRRIRPQLERRAARDSSDPSLVTLNGERTVNEVLEQIQKQSRNRLAIDEAVRKSTERRLNVDWDKQPFWKCLEDVCRLGDLEWRYAEDKQTIRVSVRQKTSRKPLFTQSTGPFWLAIENIEIRDVVGDEQQHILRIGGRLMIEPRLRPLFLSMATRDLHATLDDQTSLLPWSPDAKYEYPIGDGGRETFVQWDFRLPADISAKNVSIEGQLHCQIAAATERVVFDQLALDRGTMRRRGGVTVRIREASFESIDDGKLNANIGVIVNYDYGGPAFESHRSWMFHNAVYLETKTGARTNFTDFDLNQQADGAVAVDYRWKAINGPSNEYQLVYEAPTLIINVPVNINLVEMSLNR